MLQTCPRCRRPFVRRQGLLCPACTWEREQEYRKVRAFLYARPYATLQDTAQETGLSLRRVLALVRSRRIGFKHDRVRPVTCAKCGAAIAPDGECHGCSAAQTAAKRLEVLRKGYVRHRGAYRARRSRRRSSRT